MQVIRDNIWLCVDCLFVAVNGDYTPLDYHYSAEESAKRVKAIDAGLEKLGAHLVPDFDSESDDDDKRGIREFSSCGCDCCGSRLAGEFHRFAILGEETPDDEPPTTERCPKPSDPPESHRSFTRDGQTFVWCGEHKTYYCGECGLNNPG